MGRIHAITPFTMLDYPEEIACIVWFSKCNLRCVYCHNPDIVFGEHASCNEDECLAFLRDRRGKLTGVVLSGGEPTLCGELLFYAEQAKQMGFKVKLDTNGTMPKPVGEMLDKHLVDYIALDFKCPPAKAPKVIGTDKFSAAYAETLAMAVKAHNDGRVKLEIRTTFHTDFMDEADLNAIMDVLKQTDYRGTYYIQNIVSVGDSTIGNVAKPSRDIDISKLVKPASFAVAFRNFPKLKSL